MHTKLITHLSDTRVGRVLTCPALFGYEGFEPKPYDWQTPFYFISGRIVHEGVEEIVQRYVEIGPYDAEAEGLVKTLTVRASLRINQKILPEKKENIMWLPISLTQTLAQSSQSKAIANIKRSVIFNTEAAFKAVAKLCTLPVHHTQTWLELDFSKHNVTVPNLFSSGDTIPIKGVLDRLDKLPNGDYIISDWKTGKKSRFTENSLKNNKQMLMYAHALKQMHGVYPKACYIVSLDVTKDLVDSSSAHLLETPDFRFLADINPEEQLPELFRLYNDVWYMLKQLHLQNTHQSPIQTDWVPLSIEGKKHNLQENLSANKLIAKPGRECDMCPAKLSCQQDHKDVWSEWNKKHLPGTYVEFLANPYLDLPIPDGEKEISTLEEIVITPQPTLFELTGSKPSPLKNGKLKDRELRASGMYSPKQILAMLNKLAAFIPPVNGQLCPCRRTERIPLQFVLVLPDLLSENDQHKATSEKPLYTSQTVLELIKSCTIKGCPHACKNEEEVCPPALPVNQIGLST